MLKVTNTFFYNDFPTSNSDIFIIEHEAENLDPNVNLSTAEKRTYSTTAAVHNSEGDFE